MYTRQPAAPIYSLKAIHLRISLFSVYEESSISQWQFYPKHVSFAILVEVSSVMREIKELIRLWLRGKQLMYQAPALIVQVERQSWSEFKTFVFNNHNVGCDELTKLIHEINLFKCEI